MKTDDLKEGLNIRPDDTVWISSGLVIQHKLGYTVWYLDGKIYREDGPAIEWTNGTNEWLLHGQKHRDDGPAIEWGNGCKQWFINDIEYTEEEFNQWLEKKALNDKLQSSLEERPSGKKGKI